MTAPSLDQIIADLRMQLDTAEIERDCLKLAIAGLDIDMSLPIANFVEMARTSEAARLGAIARATKAEAERDAAVEALFAMEAK
jgi:hypothetical protein